jgi:hypothetical protein
VADVAGFRQLGSSDLGGHGDGMQVLREGDVLYVGHFGPSRMGTSILDVSDPSRPQLVRQWRAPRGSHTHKVQVADGLLLTNVEAFPYRGGISERPGMVVHSLEDPYNPREIGFFDSTGRGVHRIVWTGGRYAYVSATPEGFDDRIWVVVDLADPEHPVEAGRWWWRDPVPDGRRYAAHHALIDGDRAYLGYGDAGMVILDIADVTDPKVVSTLGWEPGGDTHTCMPLPGRDLVVVTDETVTDRCVGERHLVRVISIADERAPEVAGIAPEPQGDFCERGLRFGPHNLHENRPGSYVSGEVVFCTYFNAGLRVYDLADAAAPVEVAHWIPDTPPGQEAVQSNDLFVDEEGLVYVTDRVGGGVAVLEPEPALLARMREASA